MQHNQLSLCTISANGVLTKEDKKKWAALTLEEKNALAQPWIEKVKKDIDIWADVKDAPWRRKTTDFEEQCIIYAITETLKQGYRVKMLDYIYEIVNKEHQNSIRFAIVESLKQGHFIDTKDKEK